MPTVRLPGSSGGGGGWGDQSQGSLTGVVGDALFDGIRGIGNFFAPDGTLSSWVNDAATRIEDNAQSGAGGGAGGGGASPYVDTTAARNATQAMLDSTGKQLSNMDQTALNEYNALMDAYRAENEANKKNYQTQVDKNESTRSGGISQSLAAAAQGGRGLRAALAALGALGGTGSLLANRAIASSANKDIGGVNETFDTNATGLNTAWEKTEREQRQRDEDAEAALKNARKKNAGTIAEQRQGLYKDMAGYWEQAGNKGEAANWLAKVASQNPFIEAASLAATPSFQRGSANFSPAALKNYLAGNQDMSVQADTGSSGVTMNSPLYASSRRREEYA